MSGYVSALARSQINLKDVSTTTELGNGSSPSLDKPKTVQDASPVRPWTGLGKQGRIGAQFFYEDLCRELQGR